ncbi:MAG: hypothetical protein M1817_003297 [Caeruleum heppii]|nr:MAG: hypothetical protein M1817_003297 [Caeruleum heppii]
MYQLAGNTHGHSSRSPITRTTRLRHVLHYLLYTTLYHISPHALATTVPAHNNATTQPDERRNTFQVLADGSQDLAALVGIFTTDSVERYVVDYSKGYLSVAVTTCSLFGILGWVRAMIKLAMGAEACEHAGLPTASLRPILGLARRDLLPAEDVTPVVYLQRREDEGQVEWRRLKRIVHTADSMPMTEIKPPQWPSSRHASCYSQIFWCSRSAPDNEGATYSGWAQAIPAAVRQWPWPEPLSSKKRRLRSLSEFLHEHVLFPGMSCLSIVLSTLTLLVFDSSGAWTRYMATAGLAGALLAGSLMWAWVYRQEHQPSEDDEKGFRHLPEHLAFFRTKEGYVAFEARAAVGFTRNLIRLGSLCAAGIAALGYICQYIEIRKMSASRCGIWLGIQGGLALLRISVWIVRPFFALPSANANSRLTASALVTPSFQQPKVRRALTEFEFVLARFDDKLIPHRSQFSHSSSSALEIPAWVTERFCGRIINVKSACQLVRRAREGHRDFEIDECMGSDTFWDMPDSLFCRWLQFRFRHDAATLTRMVNDKHFLHWGCRVIISKGKISLWPGFVVFLNKDSAPGKHWEAYPRGTVFTCPSYPSPHARPELFAFQRPYGQGQEAPLIDGWETLLPLLMAGPPRYSYAWSSLISEVGASFDLMLDVLESVSD